MSDVKTEYRDVETGKLQKLLDAEYEKVPKRYMDVVNKIREMELELESRSNM